MKNASTFVKSLFLTVCVGAVAFAGCGEKKGTPVEQFKSAMITMSKDMTDIAESIKTPEDAEKAEPKVAEAMEKMAATITDAAQRITPKDAEAMQHVMEDADVKASMEKSEAAMSKLKTEHPDAAAKLEEVSKKHGEKLQNAMMGVMSAMMQKMGKDGGAAGSGAPSEPPPSTAAPSDTMSTDAPPSGGSDTGK